MWEQIKTTRNNVVLNLNYEDFATIEVEKKTNNKGILFYEISFHLEDVTDQSIICYKLAEVSKVLEKAKILIEELFVEKDDFTQEELYNWLDEFVENINEY